MRYEIVPVTPFAQNCSVLACADTGRGAVVDPGGDIQKIQAAIERLGTRVEKIFLTHAHIDHAGATAALARELAVPIEGPHKDDQFWIDLLPEQGAMFGLPGGEVFEPDRWLEGGDTPMLHYLFTSDGPRQPPAAPSCIESQLGFLPQDGTTGDFL